MNTQFDLSDCTLSTEDQAVVDAVNEFLALLPDDADPKPALWLAMVILEAADVAPQADLARVANFGQSRSLREYKQRLREEGLAGLWDHPIPGRPAITTRTLVEKALFQVILSAVIEEHALPDDVILANRVNQVLSEDLVPEAGCVTASMVETIRLRWDIRRPALNQQLRVAQRSQVPQPDMARLGQTCVGGAFILAVLLVETGWLKLAQHPNIVGIKDSSGNVVVRRRHQGCASHLQRPGWLSQLSLPGPCSGRGGRDYGPGQ